MTNFKNVLPTYVGVILEEASKELEADGTSHIRGGDPQLNQLRIN